MNPQFVRIIINDFSDGFFNMAVDEAIFSGLNKGFSPSTLRFYQWKPNTISFGYFQNLLSLIDFKKIKTLKIDYVRRLTGGGIVCHSPYELSCSWIGNISNFNLKERNIYYIFSQIFKKSLNKLDITAKIQLEKPSFVSSLCFITPYTYDLVIDKKKVVGSAERRRGNIILHQSSILLDSRFLNILFPVFGNLTHLSNLKMIGLKEIKKGIKEEEIREAIINSVEEYFNIKLIQKGLSCWEKAKVKTLIKKYKSKEWNLKNGKKK